MLSSTNRSKAARSGAALALLLLALLLRVPQATCTADHYNPAMPFDLRAAWIVVLNDLSGAEQKAIDMLVDEIAARTRLRLPVENDWPADAKTPVIAVGPRTSLEGFAGHFANDLAANGQQHLPEGFQIRTMTPADRAPVILVIGNDARGVLFGVGKLLRSLSMSRDRIELPVPLDLTTAPAMPIRGHQLGFRPKTNSYDAWDLAQWEQYIRDLVVFG